MYRNPTPVFDQHKHILLSTIFANIRKFGPDEVIIAIDDRSNWRKKFYSEYKANRKEKRDVDLFPWEIYFEYINKFTEELKDNFPFKFIQIPYAEADDVIAILSKHLTNSINTIITTDSDYIQLLHQKNVRIYDPLKKKLIVDKDPLKTLHIKVIAGDSGDNVPGIKPRVGPKTAIKLIDTGGLDELLKEDVIRQAYERNKKLIDWNFIPEVIQKATLKSYDEYKIIEEFNTMNVMKFLVKNKLRKHMEDLSIIKQVLDPLVDNKNSIKVFF